ncbi:40S ribosomal protein S3a [Nymphon striatum]|nr:40S ribosomal protein S3a [Nymphon striatum]
MYVQNQHWKLFAQFALLEIASEGLKGRVFETSLADLQNDEISFRKFKLIAEDVQGKNVLTTFHGMNLTTDKLRSMVKKWLTLIEANVDVRTTDGYLLRIFCIGFTKRMINQAKKTCYAQSKQIKNVRKKMIEIISRDVSSNDLKEIVNKLIPDSMGKDIEKACEGIFPLQDVYIRKVKVLKKPKFDLGRLMDLHGEGTSKPAAPGAEDTGVKADRADNFEPPVQESTPPSSLKAPIHWNACMLYFIIMLADVAISPRHGYKMDAPTRKSINEPFSSESVNPHQKAPKRKTGNIKYRKPCILTDTLERDALREKRQRKLNQKKTKKTCRYGGNYPECACPAVLFTSNNPDTEVDSILAVEPMPDLERIMECSLLFCEKICNDEYHIPYLWFQASPNFYPEMSSIPAATVIMEIFDLTGSGKKLIKDLQPIVLLKKSVFLHEEERKIARSYPFLSNLQVKKKAIATWKNMELKTKPKQRKAMTKNESIAPGSGKKIEKRKNKNISKIVKTPGLRKPKIIKNSVPISESTKLKNVSSDKILLEMSIPSSSPKHSVTLESLQNKMFNSNPKSKVPKNSINKTPASKTPKTFSSVRRYRKSLDTPALSPVKRNGSAKRLFDGLRATSTPINALKNISLNKRGSTLKKITSKISAGKVTKMKKPTAIKGKGKTKKSLENSRNLTKSNVKTESSVKSVRNKQNSLTASVLDGSFMAYASSSKSNSIKKSTLSTKNSKITPAKAIAKKNTTSSTPSGSKKSAIKLGKHKSFTALDHSYVKRKRTTNNKTKEKSVPKNKIKTDHTQTPRKVSSSIKQNTIKSKLTSVRRSSVKCSKHSVSKNNISKLNVSGSIKKKLLSSHQKSKTISAKTPKKINKNLKKPLSGRKGVKASVTLKTVRKNAGKESSKRQADSVKKRKQTSVSKNTVLSARKVSKSKATISKKGRVTSSRVSITPKAAKKTPEKNTNKRGKTPLKRQISSGKKYSRKESAKKTNTVRRKNAETIQGSRAAKANDKKTPQRKLKLDVSVSSRRSIPKEVKISKRKSDKKSVHKTTRGESVKKRKKELDLKSKTPTKRQASLSKKAKNEDVTKGRKRKMEIVKTEEKKSISSPKRKKVISDNTLNSATNDLFGSLVSHSMKLNRCEFDTLAGCISAPSSEIIPKKRGRPKKIVTSSPTVKLNRRESDAPVGGISASSSEKIPKKRGRPKKIVTATSSPTVKLNRREADTLVGGISAPSSEKIQKKRGRPKKNDPRDKMNRHYVVISPTVKLSRREADTLVAGISAPPSEKIPKKRGRPKKNDPRYRINRPDVVVSPTVKLNRCDSDTHVGSISAPSSEKIPKKRGRPKKVDPRYGINRHDVVTSPAVELIKCESDTLVGDVSAPSPEKTAKKRGRPKKNDPRYRIDPSEAFSKFIESTPTYNMSSSRKRAKKKLKQNDSDSDDDDDFCPVIIRKASANKFQTIIPSAINKDRSSKNSKIPQTKLSANSIKSNPVKTMVVSTESTNGATFRKSKQAADVKDCAAIDEITLSTESKSSNVILHSSEVNDDHVPDSTLPTEVTINDNESDVSSELDVSDTSSLLNNESFDCNVTLDKSPPQSNSSVEKIRNENGNDNLIDSLAIVSACEVEATSNTETTAEESAIENASIACESEKIIVENSEEHLTLCEIVSSAPEVPSSDEGKPVLDGSNGNDEPCDNNLVSEVIVDSVVSDEVLENNSETKSNDDVEAVSNENNLINDKSKENFSQVLNNNNNNDELKIKLLDNPRIGCYTVELPSLKESKIMQLPFDKAAKVVDSDSHVEKPMQNGN